MPLLRKYCVLFCFLRRKFRHRFYFKNIYTAYAPQLVLKSHKKCIGDLCQLLLQVTLLNRKNIDITGFLLF